MGKKKFDDVDLFDLFGSNRHERLSLKLRVEDTDPLSVKQEVKTLLGRVPPFHTGDTLVIDYALSINYFGDVAKKLTAILALAEKGVILEGSISEFTQGQSLILEVARLLQQLPQYVVRPTDVVEKIGCHDPQ